MICMVPVGVTWDHNCVDAGENGAQKSTSEQAADWARVGVARYHCGDLDGAITACRQALCLDHGLAETWDILAKALAAKEKSALELPGTGSNPTRQAITAPALGDYVITREAKVTGGILRESGFVACLAIGTRVKVLEIVEGEGRWRARIEEPTGWISVRSTGGECVWAVLTNVEARRHLDSNPTRQTRAQPNRRNFKALAEAEKVHEEAQQQLRDYIKKLREKKARRHLGSMSAGESDDGTDRSDSSGSGIDIDADLPATPSTSAGVPSLSLASSPSFTYSLPPARTAASAAAAPEEEPSAAAPAAAREAGPCHAASPVSASPPAPDFEERHAELSIGDCVLARFYGEWHPASVRRLGLPDGLVEVLWASEWSVSRVPASDVQFAVPPGGLGAPSTPEVEPLPEACVAPVLPPPPQCAPPPPPPPARPRPKPQALLATPPQGVRSWATVVSAGAAHTPSEVCHSPRSQPKAPHNPAPQSQAQLRKQETEEGLSPESPCQTGRSWAAVVTTGTTSLGGKAAPVANRRK